MILPLFFLVPVCVLLGGFPILDSGITKWWGLTVASVIGVFFGLAFRSLQSKSIMPLFRFRLRPSCCMAVWRN